MLKKLPFILSLLFGLSFQLSAQVSQITSTKGVLDLSRQNFDNGEIIPLQGQWEFYWKELIHPVDFEASSLKSKPIFIDYTSQGRDLPAVEETRGQFGYATYRLLINLGEDQ